MTTLGLLKRFARDDRAQAMTEFVIVLPIILLMFFAAIESLVIARAAQLGNYAAFAAARSYATSFSKFEQENGDDADKAHDEAVSRAKRTVLLIMAPISQAQVGEALGLWNLVRGTALSAGGLLWDMYGIAEGYAIAALYRVYFPDDFIERPANVHNRKAVVKVKFVYSVPMSIPGFAEMWDFFAAKGHGNTAVDEFIYGSPYFLADVVDTVEQILDGLAKLNSLTGVGAFGQIKTQIENAIEQAYDSGVLGAMHTVRINCKSACGFEPWSGTPRTDDTEPYCEAEFDEEMQPCLDATESNQELVETQATECEEARVATNLFVIASNNYDVAQANLDTCLAPEPDPPCTDEWAARNTALQEKIDAYNHAETQTDECEAAGRAVEESQRDIEELCTQ